MVRFRNFKNVKFHNKLLLTYMLLVLLPLVSLGLYAYKVASESILDNSRFHGTSVSGRLNERFNELISEAAMVSSYPIGDEQLQQVLEKNYAEYRYGFYEQVQDVKSVEHFINQLMNIHLNLDYLLFYPFNQQNAILHANRGGKYFIQSSDVRDADWYKAAIAADGNWVYTGLRREDSILGSPDVLTVSRLIKSLPEQRPLAVISVMIDRMTLVKMLNEAEADGEFSFLLFDGSCSKLAASAGAPAGYDPAAIGAGEPLVHIGGRDYSQIVNRSDRTGWSIVAVAKRDAIVAKLLPILRGLMLTILVMLAVSVIISFLLSRSLVSPLLRLKRSMSRTQHGSWEPVAMEPRTDEVGELARHYNNMIAQLETDVELLLEQERQKKDLEFQSLQAQINPHFIYNTLSAINWISNMGDRRSVSEMIEALVYILRSVSNLKSGFIAFQDEREFLERYLTIMRIRYHDQFRVVWKLSESILDLDIPRMILQPVIENAILHGLEKEDDSGLIVIEGFREDDVLIVTITDNGIGFDRTDGQPEAPKFSSIGLDNVVQRLELLYGGGAEMTIDSRPNEGTKVAFRLPLLTGQASPGRTKVGDE